MTNSGSFSLNILRWILSLSLLTPSLALAKPVQVTGSVDRNEMGVGDTFTFTIEVASESSLNIADPSLPNLSANGFELINQWSGVESRSTYANGTFEVVQSRNFNYMLSASKAGTFKIPSIAVVVEGKPYQTQPITLRVLEGRAAPPQAKQDQTPGTFEDVEDIFNQLLQRRLGRGGGGGTRTQPVNPEEAFFIQVDVDKTKAYAGEQVTASWYLYTRGQIHDIDTLKYPSLNGFWKEEIELATRLNFQQEVVNGIVYQKALLASYALFPIKAGNSTVDSYKAKCTVTVPSNFGFSRPYQFTKVSKPIQIQVQDVPKDNRPANYTGAVGQFTAKASVAETTVAAHQPLSYKIRFEGRGNAKLIDLPALDLPAGIEIYDTKNEAKFFREGTSYKEFELVLIPRQAGQVVLPAITFSAFEPGSGKFYPVSTQSVTLNVLPGVAPQAGASTPMADGGKAQNKSSDPSLPPLAMSWEAGTSVSVLPRWVMWTFLYVLVLAGLAWRLISSAELFRRRQDMLKLVNKRLESINVCADKGDWRGVGVQGTNLLYFVLGQLSEQGGAGQEISKLLLDLPPSVRRELTDPATKLLQILELLSFAPENLVGERKEKKALKALLKELSSLSLRAAAMASQKPEDEKVEGPA
ncbi:MAG: BatD family protein [Bdellovibrionales bacterium]